MAVLQIYVGPHWMDELSETELQEWLKKDKRNQAKYDRRYRPGDIVNVWPDEKCKEKPAPGTKLAFVRVSDLDYYDARHLDRPLEDWSALTYPVTKKRRKYAVNIDDLTTLEKSDLETKKEITINNSYFETKKETKTLVSHG